MLDAIDIGLTNYAYYIAAGTDHTIIFYNKTYTEASVSDGTRFIDWVDEPGQRGHAAEHGMLRARLRRAVLSLILALIG